MRPFQTCLDVVVWRIMRCQQFCSYNNNNEMRDIFIIQIRFFSPRRTNQSDEMAMSTLNGNRTWVPQIWLFF